MLSLTPLTPQSPAVGKLRTLYERAFPENERRPFDEMLHETVPYLELLAIEDGKTCCGLVCLLNAADVSHIIYLAIEESLRSRGYGSAALAALHNARPGRRFIVDIERDEAGAENTVQRQKRKAFYLRNGYAETPVQYRWRGENYEILAHGGPFSKTDYEGFWKSLDKQDGGKRKKQFTPRTEIEE